MTKISRKICLLGDFAVGKTSLVRRFVYERFDDDYISTIGVKVSRKTVTIPREQDVVELTMMLWDLAGSEEFNKIRATYLRGSAGAILVCDFTRAETLANLQGYIDDLSRVSPNVPLIVAANKLDLVEEHQLTAQQISDWAKDLGISLYQTSAKTGDNVDTLFQDLGQKLVK